MKDNYERLATSQNEKNDWTIQQIKKAKFESAGENLPEYKVMQGGLRAAINRFDELAASYEQHLKNRNIK